MRVAINTGPLSDSHAVRGIGVMVDQQIKALQLEAKKKGISIEAVDFSAINLSGYDVVHYPYFFPYNLTLPSEKVGKKVVVTIQDLIHLIYPKHYPPGFKGRMNYFQQKKRLKNVDAVVTISETSKKDIVRFLKLNPDSVHVIYLAPKKVFKNLKGSRSLERISTIESVRKRFKLPKEFILYVGDINYNKNVLGLIKACRISKLPLVIVGKQALDIEDSSISLPSIEGPRDWFRFIFNIPHPELAHYKELLKEFENSNNVLRLGFVSDKDLAAIYNLAAVYCQPSFYEGFGLPVLEAMACSCPVVISKTNALVEIAGDAALIADPNNPKDMVDKISSVVDSNKVRERLIDSGLKRVKEFSWEKTAKQMINVYKKVLKSR